MPLVTLKLIAGEEDAPSPETCERLIARLTEVVSEELGKDSAATQVLIETLPAIHWGVGGQSVAAKRAQNTR